MELKLLVIRCKNIDVSKQFYETLGFAFKKEKHGQGAEHFASSSAGFVFELYPLKAHSEFTPLRLGFQLPDITEKISTQTVLQCYEQQGQITYLIQDPDGNKLELS